MMLAGEGVSPGLDSAPASGSTAGIRFLDMAGMPTDCVYAQYTFLAYFLFMHPFSLGLVSCTTSIQRNTRWPVCPSHSLIVVQHGQGSWAGGVEHCGRQHGQRPDGAQAAVAVADGAVELGAPSGFA